MAYKVSIITVSYNSGQTIEHTLKSILEQTYPHIELIVIDGGSTDQTIEILNKYRKSIAKLVSEKDNGIYDAMNKGIRLASGDIIGILNSDDMYAYKEYLSEVVEAFNKSAKPDIVYSNLVYVDANNEKILRFWNAGRYKKNSFKLGWMPPHPTVFVTRELYEKAGGFNSGLKYSADYEFLLRVFECFNSSHIYLPKTGVRMRVGGVSNASLKNRMKANKEDRYSWVLNGLHPFPITFMLKPLRKIFQFKLFT